MWLCLARHCCPGTDDAGYTEHAQEIEVVQKASHGLWQYPLGLKGHGPGMAFIATWTAVSSSACAAHPPSIPIPNDPNMYKYVTCAVCLSFFHLQYFHGIFIAILFHLTTCGWGAKPQRMMKRSTLRTSSVNARHALLSSNVATWRWCSHNMPQLLLLLQQGPLNGQRQMTYKWHTIRILSNLSIGFYPVLKSFALSVAA